MLELKNLSSRSSNPGRSERRPLARIATIAASVMALASLLVPAVASADTAFTSIGTRSVQGNVVIKTAAPPNVNIPPAPAEAQFYVSTKCPHLWCKIGPVVGCLLPCPGPLASTNSSPSYCQQYRQDYECTGYDPVDQQCDQDAQTVAAHTWHPDYGPTISSWERWSQSCQSNWSAYGETDGGLVTAWAQYGSPQTNGWGVSSTSYTLNNGTYVYGQMLFGGQGTSCVTAAGDGGYFEDTNSAWRNSAGCV